MKKLIFASMLGFLALSQAAEALNGRYLVVSDSIRWGSSVDSGGFVGYMPNDDTTEVLLFRDSAGAFVVASDSCSKPIKVETMGRRSSNYYEVRYDVRASDGNDSSIARFRFESRYCRDIDRSTGCDSWTRYGKHAGYGGLTVLDTLSTTAADTAWTRVTQTFFLPGGNQFRACIGPVTIGGEAADTTLFRRWILRGY